MVEGQAKYRPYPAYKPSGVEWVGDIPKDWQTLRVKFATDFRNKKRNATSADAYVGLENVVPWVGEHTPTLEQEIDGLSLAFRSGDVLFGKLRPYLAKSWQAIFDGVCSSEFLVMVSQYLEPKFLNYVTLTTDFINQVDGSTYGSKMPRASSEFIGQLKIPYPSSDEAAKIAAFLDHETAKIDSLIAKQQRLIALMEEKRQAVISHAVTKGLDKSAPLRPSGIEWLGDVPEHWEVRAIKHSVSIPITDGPHETPNFVDEGIPFVSAEAVSSGRIDFAKIRAHITERDHARFSQKYTPKLGDIFMVKSGATTGKLAMVEDDLVFNIWSPLAAIRCRMGINPRFILHFMRSAQFQEAIRLYWSFGTQQNIGMKVIENLHTTIPPLKEQNSISNILDEHVSKFDGLFDKAQSAINLLKERRTALISAAVTGKIDLRDWQPPKGAQPPSTRDINQPEEALA